MSLPDCWVSSLSRRGPSCFRNPVSSNSLSSARKTPLFRPASSLPPASPSAVILSLNKLDIKTMSVTAGASGFMICLLAAISITGFWRDNTHRLKVGLT